MLLHSAEHLTVCPPDACVLLCLQRFYLVTSWVFCPVLFPGLHYRYFLISLSHCVFAPPICLTAGHPPVSPQLPSSFIHCHLILSKRLKNQEHADQTESSFPLQVSRTETLSYLNVSNSPTGSDWHGKMYKNIGIKCPQTFKGHDHVGGYTVSFNTIKAKLWLRADVKEDKDVFIKDMSASSCCTSVNVTWCIGLLLLFQPTDINTTFATLQIHVNAMMHFTRSSENPLTPDKTINTNESLGIWAVLYGRTVSAVTHLKHWLQSNKKRAHAHIKLKIHFLSDPIHPEINKHADSGLFYS